MTAKEMIKQLNQMENTDRIEFFNYLSEHHFNTLSDEAKKILDDYYEGLLVEVKDDKS